MNPAAGLACKEVKEYTMFNSSRLLALTGVLLLSLCTAPVARADHADPPGRVARLNHSQGEVSYSPAGEDDWVSIARNRPLIRGDRLWTDSDARAELQMGSTAIRLGPDTSFEILELSDRVAQVQLTQGTINLRVRRMYPGQVYEVATPTLAFTINRAGRYRIDVDPHDDETTIVVWEGAGEAYGDNASFPLRAGDTVRFYGTDLRDHEMYGLPRADDFDRYCLDRDRRLDGSGSLRYVGDDVVGYADLDEYGSWRRERSYGSVWFPSRVDADWAPYRDGHWVWQEPWGWTWVDDQPWGFAPSHYGRWVYVSNRWGWIPGPRNVRPVYAPALVAFVGGHGWSVSLSFGGDSPIGWFPLGPREVYVPSYRASRDYFTRVNVRNTVINNTTINNVYNNYSSGNTNVTQVNHANRAVAGAITAVPRTVFVNAKPVRPAAIRLDRNAATSGEITRVAPLAPTVHSVIGTGTAARARPSREAVNRGVVARNAPPPGERPFAAREQQLQKNPGRALESAAESAQSGGGRRNVRVIPEQRSAVNARDTGSRGEGGKPGAAGGAPGPLQQLDRSDKDKPRREPGPGGHTRDQERNGRNNAQPPSGQAGQAAREQQAAEQQRAERQRNAENEQQTQRQRKAEDEQKAAEQQRAERQRQAETQQQEQRQRKAEGEQQAAEQQRAERQRKAENEQQTQRQRKAEDEQKAAEQQRAERQRQAETQHQEQRQRKAESEKQAAEQQRAERQRKAESEQQAQRQRRAEDEKQAAEQQRGERQRQAETQQQEQRQRKAEGAQQVAEQQRAERQAECERQAVQNQQDPNQCGSATPPHENRGSRADRPPSQGSPRGNSGE
jgi:hypothetical protein